MTSHFDAVSPGALERRAAPLPGRTAWFIALWLAWAALLAGAMIAGNLAAGHGSSAATWLRMGSSVALVVTAWLAWTLWQRSAPGPFAVLIAVGMSLGTIGDFFNAGLLEFIPLKDNTLGGIIAFGLGHVAYIAACLSLARSAAGLSCRRTMLAAVIAWQLFGLVAWYFVVFQGIEKRDLIWPALGYTLLLAGTAGVATGLALQDRRLTALALGAALFLISDLILAFGLFRGSFAHQTECVWLTYGPGQMLIVFSVLSAAAVLARKPSA
jgi:uncharacterized membrane protein YhhN